MPSALRSAVREAQRAGSVPRRAGLIGPSFAAGCHAGMMVDAATTERTDLMCETKRGPHGETTGIDGPESRWGRAWEWWAATAGIRFIAFTGLLTVAGVVLMAVIAR